MYRDMINIRATETSSSEEFAEASISGIKPWLIVSILSIHFVQVLKLKNACDVRQTTQLTTITVRGTQIPSNVGNPRQHR